MPEMLNQLVGVKVGHFTNKQKRTGCTVILCDGGAMAGVDIHGPVLGTHEIDLVRSGQLVERVNAVVITGRSAYGLSVVAGVMRFLEEHKQGYRLPHTDVHVPIVTAASIFDITSSHDVGGLDADAGYQACLAACQNQFSAQGAVGAGIGARVGKFYGAEYSSQSGVGTVIRQLDRFRVGVLAVVNSFGSIYGPNSELLAGPRHPQTGELVSTVEMIERYQTELTPWTNNAIGVIITDLTLDKRQANALAQSAFAGWVKTIKPSSSQTDGFVTYVLSTGKLPMRRSSQELTRLETGIVNLLGVAITNAVTGNSTS